ncbi:MAG: hypothetical protein SFW36_23915 [Leptolyngbyaceae cyanobacterium bins.59]|nr:hypothetical protein [Leptolyngbyaceae cyanobacterium bins.59]
MEPKKRKKFKVEYLKEIKDELLEKYPTKTNDKELNQKKSIKRLTTVIKTLRKRGYTYEEIAAILKEMGFDISSSTLKSYTQRGKSNKAGSNQQATDQAQQATDQAQQKPAKTQQKTDQAEALSEGETLNHTEEAEITDVLVEFTDEKQGLDEEPVETPLAKTETEDSIGKLFNSQIEVRDDSDEL